MPCDNEVSHAVERRRSSLGRDGPIDPLAVPGMRDAMDRLDLARRRDDWVVVFHDYDVDGVTGGALLVDALTQFGITHVRAYTPHRTRHGYGVTRAAMDAVLEKAYARRNGRDLIVTVDCGSNDGSVYAQYAQTVEFIVTDHHVLGRDGPADVAAYVNPSRDPSSPYANLSGAGVAYMLAMGLHHGTSPRPVWTMYAALGTMCDVVALVGVNRTIARAGLLHMRSGAYDEQIPGVCALMRALDVRRDTITSETVSYYIGPAINAPGRMAHASLARRLLTTIDPNDATARAARVLDANARRKTEQRRVLDAATARVRGDPSYGDDEVLVIAAEDGDWHLGVLGIVAAKLCERHGKPVMMFSGTKGSGRSHDGYDLLGNVVASAGDMFVAVGGHRHAIGYTVARADVARNVRVAINACARSSLVRTSTVDADLDVPCLRELRRVYDEFDVLEPYGPGNVRPILRSRGIRVVRRRLVGSRSSAAVQMTVTDGETIVGAICFDPDAVAEISTDDTVDVLYRLTLDTFRHATTAAADLPVQMHVVRMSRCF